MIAWHRFGFLAFGLFGGLGCNQGGQGGHAASPAEASALAAEQEEAAQAAALLVATEIALAFDAEVAAQLVVAAALDEEAALQAEGEREGEREPDVIYVPTPGPVVDRMLELAAVDADDIVYDLGCGDGRIVITAAQRYGVKAWGFDIDPVRVAEARANAKAAGVEDLVTIEQQDIFTLDLSPASVVTLYLLPELNVRLIPQLEQLAPGSRIVSHDFDMQGVTPIAQETMNLGARDIHRIFLWRTPFDRAAEAKAPTLEPTLPAPAAPPGPLTAPEPPVSSDAPAPP